MDAVAVANGMICGLLAVACLAFLAISTANGEPPLEVLLCCLTGLYDLMELPLIL